jgi:acyl-CoA thioester hydrolase
MSERQQYDHFERFRVRYSEVDNQGIVFNAHYLTYFDQAITEYIRAIDFDYREMVARLGVEFHTVRAVVDYKRPIVMDSLIDVAIAPARIGNSSLTWGLAIFYADQDELLSTGEVVWVCSLRGAHVSHPLPAELVDRLRPRLRAT